MHFTQVLAIPTADDLKQYFVLVNFFLLIYPNRVRNFCRRKNNNLIYFMCWTAYVCAFIDGSLYTLHCVVRVLTTKVCFGVCTMFFLHFRDLKIFYINIPMNATLAPLSNFCYTRFKITPVSQKKVAVSCEMRAAGTNYRTQTERRVYLSFL